MIHLRIPLVALLVAFPVLAPQALRAQNILVTTGEHATFTRLVLQSAQPIDWRLDPPGPDGRSDGASDGDPGPGPWRALRVSPAEARIDLSRAFRRIGRNRLAGLERTDDGLVLRLACDCPIRAWDERPGLVVLDIGNPEVSAPAGAPGPAAASVPPPAFTPASTPAVARNPHVPALSPPVPGDALARAAGIALARSWPSGVEQSAMPGAAAPQGPMPSPMAEPEREAILRQLAAQVAGALAQGILDPSHERPAAAEMIRLGNGDAPHDIPPNLRIMSVLERPEHDSARLPDDTPHACAAAAVLDFAISDAPANFNSALAARMGRWIGEFDQPVQSATEDLIVLYLQHGFGAEARALIENAVQPLAGRDLLLGVADMLEDRQSNSRLRLAEHHRCGGAAAMLAALAGAPAQHVAAQAVEIAGAFALAPGVLRVGLGGALIRVLLDAGATDAGRVVADTLRRTPHARSEDLHMADALLDQARGNSAQAGARLVHGAGEDAATVLLRLQLALETGARVPDTVLLNAEAIASTHRASGLGTELMAAIIRLRVAAGTAQTALDALDRLDNWQAGSSQGRALLQDLGNEVWHGLARDAPDPVLLDAILNRTDWRNPAFSSRTRTALAERLLQFGLFDAAQTLVHSPETASQRHLLARLHLERNQPEQALATLAADISETAANLRAQALQARGDSRESGLILAGLGAYEAAARAAVLSRDWEMLEQAWEGGGTNAQQELARALAGLPFARTSPRERPAPPPAAAPSPDGNAAAAPREGATGQGEPDPRETGRDRAALPSAGVRDHAREEPTTPTTPSPATPDAPNATDATDAGPAAVLAARSPQERPTQGHATPQAPLLPDAMQRGAALLEESARLRAAFEPLLTPVPGAARN